MEGIGGNGSSADAIRAHLRRMQAHADRLGAKPAASEGAETAKFSDYTKESLGEVESQVERTNELHADVLEGRLDIHEVAAQLKETEITFQFALQVRNKLLDAYREVMRMSV